MLSYSKIKMFRQCPARYWRGQQCEARTDFVPALEEPREEHSKILESIVSGISPFEYRLPDIFCTLDWQTEKYITSDFLHGYVDLFASNGDVAYIVEVKTYPARKTEIEQLEFYSAILYLNGFKNVHCFLVCPTHYYEVSYDEHALLRLLNHFLSILDSIEKTEKFFEQPGGHCIFCEFLHACPSAKSLQIADILSIQNDEQKAQEVAKRLIVLEAERAQLVDLARELRIRGFQVQYGTVRYDFDVSESLECSDIKGFFEFLRERDIDPFEIKLKSWKKARSIFKVDTSVARALSSIIEGIENFFEVKRTVNFKKQEVGENG